MNQKQTDGYKDRLQQALKTGPRAMSVQKLSDELGENAKYKDLRGKSYGGVRWYYEGRTTNPRVELLMAFADVLKVPGNWLAFGDGSMWAEEAVADEVGRAALGRRWLPDHSKALKRVFGATTPAVVDAVVAHHWRRLDWRSSTTREPWGDADQLLESLAEAMLAPLNALGIDLSSILDIDDRAEYLMGVVPFIASVMERHIMLAEIEAITAERKQQRQEEIEALTLSGSLGVLSARQDEQSGSALTTEQQRQEDTDG